MSEKTCEECDGSGEVLDAPGDVLGVRAYWVVCPECGGSGTIDTEQKADEH